MSGHSHWSGIKHKKAANDAKRGKVWSKLARLIIVAAKTGGGDPSANLALRYAIDKAKAANMPKDTIEKAVKKGTGELEGQSFEEILYEGYGPDGVAVMIEALTDNRNRTAPEIKKIFERRGGSLGTSGCVNWMFSKKGLITVNQSDAEEEQLMELALSAGADDMTTDANVYEITCDPSAYEGLKNALQEKEIPTQVAELSMIAQNDVAVGDADTAKKIIALMEDLEDHDDVQNVYSNFDIPDEIMSKIESN
jgi:YebC/PmpR family DNA-binding regulatory protein